MTYWLSKAFKDLQADWYQRLQDDGFRDAEEIVNGELELKQQAEHCYEGTTDIQRENKEEYFARLSHFVCHEDFDNGIDKLILSLYSEGYSKSRIAQVLRMIPPRRPPSYASELARSRKTVWYRICIYEARWGLRAEPPAETAYSAPGDRHKKRAG